MNTFLTVNPKFSVLDGSSRSQMKDHFSPYLLCENISSSNTGEDIANWIRSYRTDFKKRHGFNFRPTFVMTDCSIPMETGILLAFNDDDTQITLNVYCSRILVILLNKDYRIIESAGNKPELNDLVKLLKESFPTLLKECRPHVVKAWIRWANEKAVLKQHPYKGRIVEAVADLSSRATRRNSIAEMIIHLCVAVAIFESETLKCYGNSYFLDSSSLSLGHNDYEEKEVALILNKFLEEELKSGTIPSEQFNELIVSDKADIFAYDFDGVIKRAKDILCVSAYLKGCSIQGDSNKGLVRMAIIYEWFFGNEEKDEEMLGIYDNKSDSVLRWKKSGGIDLVVELPFHCSDGSLPNPLYSVEVGTYIRSWLKKPALWSRSICHLFEVVLGSGPLPDNNQSIEGWINDLKNNQGAVLQREPAAQINLMTERWKAMDRMYMMQIKTAAGTSLKRKRRSLKKTSTIPGSDIQEQWSRVPVINHDVLRQDLQVVRQLLKTKTTSALYDLMKQECGNKQVWGKQNFNAWFHDGNKCPKYDSRVGKSSLVAIRSFCDNYMADCTSKKEETMGIHSNGDVRPVIEITFTRYDPLGDGSDIKETSRLKQLLAQIESIGLFNGIKVTCIEPNHRGRERVQDHGDAHNCGIFPMALMRQLYSKKVATVEESWSQFKCGSSRDTDADRALAIRLFKIENTTWLSSSNIEDGIEHLRRERGIKGDDSRSLQVWKRPKVQNAHIGGEGAFDLSQELDMEEKEQGTFETTQNRSNQEYAGPKFAFVFSALDGAESDNTITGYTLKIMRLLLPSCPTVISDGIPELVMVSNKSAASTKHTQSGPLSGTHWVTWSIKAVVKHNYNI